jgi:hypothetical protein
MVPEVPGFEGQTPKGADRFGSAKGFGDFWGWIKKQFSMEAGAAEVQPGATLLEQKEAIETDKDSSKLLRDMRDTMQKWDERGEGGGMTPGGGRAGGAGFAGAGAPGGGGAATGGPGGGMGRSGPGPGQSFPQGKGSGGPAETTGDLGDSGPVGNLAAQREGFKKELEANPQLKRFAIDAMQHEGGIQSNMEQLFNYAAMRHMTIQQALKSGQYGPVNKGIISGNISAKTAAEGESALQKVFAGSNITDYATDQGMRGDPNYAKYMANPKYWGMHKVEGAWFSAHGEAGRRWAERQRAMIDSGLRSTDASTGTANVNVDFGNQTKSNGGNVWDKGASPFIPVNVNRSPQAAIAGGGVAPFNTYSFE